MEESTGHKKRKPDCANEPSISGEGAAERGRGHTMD